MVQDAHDLCRFVIACMIGKGETAGLDPIRRDMTSRATAALRPAPCNLRTKKIKKLTTYGYIHSDWQK